MKYCKNEKTDRVHFHALRHTFATRALGVDDWAYKKGHTYGALVCDGRTHKPVVILNGRDGNELRNWLKNNQHIRVVTRDRASAYAKAISEVIPDAIQVADRFHLYQNLLKTVKDTLSRELPSRIPITNQISENAKLDTLELEDVKKN